MGLRDLYHTVKSLLPVASGTGAGGSLGGGWSQILSNEPFTGAWQKNQELKGTDLLTFHAVFSCMSLIAGDIGKLKIIPKTLKNGVWLSTKSRVDGLLKKPNNLQTWQQFSENWIISKLKRGNTYVFKSRNMLGQIEQLFVLNPDRVKPLISDDGEVFYQISRDKLFNIDSDIIVPASEIIHDRFNCLYHPLIGLSPITACTISAGQGIAIQNNATVLFQNASRPSGILTTPGPIDEGKAREVKAGWDKTYSGQQKGTIAVLGDGVTYQAISLSAEDTQMIEQLKLTAEIVCSVFHVPAFKIGLGSIPAGQKTSDLNEIYYSDCLQTFIEAMENLLDVHLDFEEGVECWADIKPLIRMDSSSQMDYLSKGTGSGIIAPNEARAEIGLPAVAGGESPLLQQQNYSLEALAKRDAQDDPFNAKTNDTPTTTPTADDTAKTVINHYHQSPNAPVFVSEVAENTPTSDEKPVFDDLYKGVFNAENTYTKGDFVTKKGGLWVCKGVSTGDFDFANWQLVSKNGGEKE